jgi:hypothetical protein
MSIIVYTSSAPNPQSSQIDFVVDLSNGETLPQSQQFYASAVDTAHAGASFTYSWTLIQKPTGSTASLSGQLTATPTLNNVDIFGNYRLFCIARNTSTLETSETSIVLAPNTSFSHARVLSETLALEKPAIGERDWSSKTNAMVDALEDLAIQGNDHETRIVVLESATEILTATTTRSGKVELATGSETNTNTINGQGQTGPLVVTPGSLIEALGGVSGTDTVVSKIQDIALNYVSDNRMSLADLDGVDNNLTPLAGTALVYNGTHWTSSSSGGLTFSDDITSDIITFGDTVKWKGTSDQVNVVYNATTNTFTSSLPSNINVNAASADILKTTRQLSLTGPITGSGNFNGSGNLAIATTITDSSIANSKLTNDSITVSDGTSSEAIQLGQTINFTGTTNKVNVAYTAATNTMNFTLPSSITANASTASALGSSQNFSLIGDVTAPAISFNGTGAVALNTSIANGSITNAKLANSSITVSNGSASEAIALGDTLNFTGTTDEVTVGYTAATNTFNFSLPSNISANASTASDINGLATTGVVRRTGANAFSTTTNLSHLSDVSDTLTIANRNVLQHNGTEWVSRNVTYTMNRSSDIFPYAINGYYEGPLFEADIDAVPANDQQSVFAWYNYTGEVVYVTGYTVIVGSSANATETHVFGLFTANNGNFKTNVYTIYDGTGGSVDSIGTTANSAKHIATLNKNFTTGSGVISVDPGTYVGVYCQTITGKSGQEHRISVNLHSFVNIIKL